MLAHICACLALFVHACLHLCILAYIICAFLLVFVYVDGTLCDELSVLRASGLGRPMDLRVEKKYYKACIYMVSGVALC